MSVARATSLRGRPQALPSRQEPPAAPRPTHKQFTYQTRRPLRSTKHSSVRLVSSFLIRSSGEDDPAANQTPEELSDAWDGRHAEVYAIKRNAAMWRLVEPIESLEYRLNMCATLLPDLPSAVWTMDPLVVARVAGNAESLAQTMINLKDVVSGADVQRLVIMTKCILAVQEISRTQQIVREYLDILVPLYDTNVVYRFFDAHSSLLDLHDQRYRVMPEKDIYDLLAGLPSSVQWMNAGNAREVLSAKYEVVRRLAPEALQAEQLHPGGKLSKKKIGKLGVY